MTRKLFESMDADSKRFYSKIFNTAILIIHAVRRGWFKCGVTIYIDVHLGLLLSINTFSISLT